MKKLLSFLMITTLLTGCVSANETIEKRIDDAISSALTLQVDHTNYSNTYYAYYLQPSIGRFYSHKISNIFGYRDIKFILNLNLSQIINEKFYPDSKEDYITLDSFPLVYQKSGEYIDINQQKYPYRVQIFQKNNDYYIELNMHYVDFYTVCPAGYASQIIYYMMNIGKSVVVNQEKVIEDFSKRQEINATRNKLELFKEIVPQNGAIDELFDKNEIIQESAPPIDPNSSIDITE